MKAIFIAGTDTGVGKTLVTGLLAGYIRGKGYSVITQKWVQTGCRGRPEAQRVVYKFRFPSSPHLASRLARRPINIGKIKAGLAGLLKRFDYVVVEGTGGLMVPIDRHTLLIDIVKDLNLPVLLVAGNRLGAINHTLLSVESLESRKIDMLGIVFNDISKTENSIILKDNPRIVKKITHCKILGTLPYTKNRSSLQQGFKAIGDKIIQTQ